MSIWFDEKYKIMNFNVLAYSVLIIFSFSVNAQEEKEIEIDYMEFSENFCEERKPVFKECLDLDVSQCREVMTEMFEKCAQENTEEGITLCMDDEWLSLLNERDLDPEAKCDVEI